MAQSVCIEWQGPSPPQRRSTDCGQDSARPKIPSMRLTDLQRQSVLAAIHAADPSAQVWLHGSRVDDQARGGDIDLLVLSAHIGLPEKLDLLAQLHQTLGQQKIDLTVARDDSRPFVRLALAQGLRL